MLSFFRVFVIAIWMPVSGHVAWTLRGNALFFPHVAERIANRAEVGEEGAEFLAEGYGSTMLTNWMKMKFGMPE